MRFWRRRSNRKAPSVASPVLHATEVGPCPNIPRCSHGHIILGCPHDDCPEQNEYLRQQREQMEIWERRLQFP